MPYDVGMPRRSSRELLYTVAPLAIAAGFAFAAHGGWLCNGGHKTRVKVVAKAEPGTSVSVYRDGQKVKAKRRRARKQRHGVDPLKIGAKIYRPAETHWVPRSVVSKVLQDPKLLRVSGDLVPEHECRGLAGFRVENTLKHGLFRKLGFHDGDLVTAIDDTRLTSKHAARQAVDALEEADQVTVTVVRGDKTLQKTFLIE